MTSPSEDFISTSTPIQHHARGLTGGFKRFYASPEKGNDLLSPIKTSGSRSYEFFNTLNSLETSYFEILNNRNKLLAGASRKLRFVETSKFVNESESLSNDSGIASECSSSTSSDLSLLGKEISYFTDENCNVINSCDNSINSNLKSFNYAFSHILNKSGFVDTKSKDKLEALDNRNKNLNNDKDQITYLDILKELNTINCYGVLSHILSKLDDEDLRKASYVSKEWHDIVLNDKEANTRKKAYIKEKRDIANGPRKENRFHPKFTVERSHKSAFLSVINSSKTEVSEQPLYFAQTVGRFDSFIQEAQNLPKEEKLVKCPKCSFPSTVHSGNMYCCTRHLCKHVFCQKCFGPVFDNHSCSVPKLNSTYPQIKIGGKQSKKNLRRL